MNKLIVAILVSLKSMPLYANVVCGGVQEAFTLKKYAAKIRKINSKYEILSQGKWKSFPVGKSADGENIRLHLVSYYEDNGLFLFTATSGENDAYMLVSSQTGDEMILDGCPIFSPSRSTIINESRDLVGMGDPPKITIFKRNGEKWHLDWVFEGQEFGLGRLHWLTEQSNSFKVLEVANGTTVKETGSGKLLYSSNKWIIKGVRNDLMQNVRSMPGDVFEFNEYAKRCESMIKAYRDEYSRHQVESEFLKSDCKNFDVKRKNLEKRYGDSYPLVDIK